MWSFKEKYKKLYDTELSKQTDAYTYYIENTEGKIDIDDMVNEGEHESVPFICLNEKDIAFSSENEGYRIYECGDYYIYESKKGSSSLREKVELVTKAYKLNSDLIYSDVDCVTCDGKRTSPFYKSAYAIDTAKCFDYYTDFYAVKKIKSRLGLETLETISHVPKVLFHYKLEDNASNPNEIYRLKNNSYLTDVFYCDNKELCDIKNEISIIIPSKDNPSLLRTCFEGINRAKVKSRINEIEVVVIDNGSTEDNKRMITCDIEKATGENAGLHIEYAYEKEDFNFSHMCNKGAEKSHGKYLLFLNDDIEITDELFLLKLLYFAKMDHIGAVGCKLLYPGDERRIQHVGITCLKYAGPSHKLSTFTDDGMLYFGRNRGVHDVTAVTGACLMVSREKYFKTGGFHDKMKVGYNDVDLCVSLYESGLYNVVNNECTLIHHESVTRGFDAASEAKLRRLDEERKLLYERHPWLLEKGDPYYNINLAEDFLDYRVNVIPDFERRDYISERAENLSSYVVKKFSKVTEAKPDADIQNNGSEANTKPDKNTFFNVESIRTNRDFVEISGWALINKKDNFLYDTYAVAMDNDGRWNAFSTAMVYREDLKAVFPEARYTELSGFFARIQKSMISPDSGRIAILIVNKQTGKKYYAGFTKTDI